MDSTKSDPTTSNNAEQFAANYPREHRLFWALDDDGDGQVLCADFVRALERNGLNADDQRLKDLFLKLNEIEGETFDFPAFLHMVQPSGALIERVLQGQLALPDFDRLAEEVKRQFKEVEKNEGGEQATYIPPLAEVNPDQFGVAVVSVDGQVLEIGDSKTDFSVQSACKPFNYCFAVNELGADKVHEHIGMEPSGQAFNARVLMSDGTGRPHNPMINAGAIMAAALIESEKPVHRRLEHVRNMWGKMFGGPVPRFNAFMASEEGRTGDNNRALGYMMKAAGVLPKGEDAVDHELRDALELYFSACSLEMNARELATAAATLANIGVCPVTRERVFEESTVRNCLTLMQMCGMYDGSGEFSVRIGVPAKSGVGGAVILVVPRLMAICIWSPRLDAIGNSVRGVEMAQKLADIYRLHIYDGLEEVGKRIDPRKPARLARAKETSEALQAASLGDLRTLGWLLNNKANLERGDYDLRTAMHLAAAEGNLDTVRFLLDHSVGSSPRDRWGGTPLDEAEQASHSDVANLLKENGAENGDPQHPGSESKVTEEAASYGDTYAVVELLWAAAENDLDELRRCVAAGIPVSASDYDGRTALHIAASEGQVEAARYLLAHDHPVHVRDRWKATPLDDARREGHDAMIELLTAAEKSFHSLSLKAHLSEIERATKFVEHYILAHNINLVVGHRVNTVLDEVLARAIENSSAEDSGHTVNLDFKVTGDHLEVVVSDDGPNFNVLTGPAPVSGGDDDDDDDEAAIYKVGVQMIKEFTTSADYCREEEWNLLTLKFQLS